MEDFSTPGLRLKHARKRRRISQGQLAELIGSDQRTISGLERDPNPHRKFGEMDRAAKVLGFRQAWLERGEGEQEENPSGEGLSDTKAAEFDHGSVVNAGVVPIFGAAAANTWRPIDNWEELADETQVPADPEYLQFKQFALRIEGTSMNKIYQPGQYAVCVDAVDMGLVPRRGDVIAVERRRGQGGEKEITIKVYGEIDGKPALIPCSTDPRYQEPLQLDGGATETDIEIEVIGLAVGVWGKPRIL